MSDMNVVDGSSAIWEQDAQALEDALDRGWSLPRARLRSGHTEDITLILRVITCGWVEGWKIWAKKRPDFASDPVLIEAILSQAQAGILQEVLAQNGNKLPWAREDGDLAPPHIMFQLIGRQMGQMGKLVPDEQVVDCAKLLIGANIDPQQPYPEAYVEPGTELQEENTERSGEAGAGSFHPSDFTPPGHTLWTWSILWGYFDLAEALNLGDEVFSMPKADLVLAHWFERAWVPSWASAHDFDGGRARITWLRWMTIDRFSRWVSQAGTMKDAGLHEALQSLPADYQEVVWRHWLQRDEQGWSVLHDLVASLLPREDIEKTMSSMQSVLPSREWDEAWKHQDEYGVSLQSLWQEKTVQPG